MSKAIIIVPCFNEEKRLRHQEFIKYCNSNDVNFFFVNDGSSDDTEKILKLIIKKTNNNYLINLKQNLGKAEAVRAGMLVALKKYDSNIFGYWDADLATPLDEINNLINHYKFKKTIMIFGSRFKRLGSNIKRNTLRHYFGRVMATFTSIILNMGVYDTQCGAKIFDKKYIKLIFEEPFYTSWLFDVEIFFRVKKFNKENQIIEIPLNSWQDIANSKITIFDFIKTPYNFLKIIIRYKFNKKYL